MDCTTALERVQDAMDGRLDAASSAALDAHVAGCPACAEERRAYAGLRSALRALPAAKAPQGFADGVMAGVARTGTPSSPPPAATAKPRGRILRVRFALAAAAVAAAVVVVAVSTGGPQPSGDDRIAGAELARNAAPESADPVMRAKRILDERVSGSGAPQEDADTADAAAAGANGGLKADDAVASAPSSPPAPSSPSSPRDRARTGGAGEERSGERDEANVPAAPGAGAGLPPTRETAAGDVAKAPRGKSGADEQEKSAAPGAPASQAGPASDGEVAPSQIVYAVFTTEADAIAFVDGLRAAGVAPPERSAERKESAESKDKSPGDEKGRPGLAGGSTLGAGGGGGGALGGGLGGGGAGGRRAAGAQGFGAGKADYVELRRLSVGAMTAERRAVVDRAAAAARGRLAESLAFQDAREPADPPAPSSPPLADGPGTPGGDGGADAARGAPATRTSDADSAAQSGSAPAKRTAKSPADVTLVIVVAPAPAPAEPVPPSPAPAPTKR